MANSPGLTGLLPSSYSLWTKVNSLSLRNTTIFGARPELPLPALPPPLPPALPPCPATGSQLPCRLPPRLTWASPCKVHQQSVRERLLSGAHPAAAAAGNIPVEWLNMTALWQSKKAVLDLSYTFTACFEAPWWWPERVSSTFEVPPGCGPALLPPCLASCWFPEPAAAAEAAPRPPALPCGAALVLNRPAS